MKSAPEGSEEVVRRKVWEESWWARRRACSPTGTALMCSFWISSMLPMLRPASLAMARLSGKLALLKLVIRFTCMVSVPLGTGLTGSATTSQSDLQTRVKVTFWRFCSKANAYGYWHSLCSLCNSKRKHHWRTGLHRVTKTRISAAQAS